MLFRIELRIVNPMAGTERTLVKQFDPATMDQNKWNTAYPAVAPLIAELKQDAGTNPNEPGVW